MFSVVVFSTGIIPGMFSRVKHWCVRRYKCICVGSVGDDDV